MLKDKKVAVIGLGKIGSLLTGAMIRSGAAQAKNVCGTTAHAASAQRAAQELGIRTLADNAAAAKGRDLVILAVKPQSMGKVLDELAGVLAPRQVVLSLAAATTLKFIEGRLRSKTPVLRAMPNLPCLVGQGMTVVCPGRFARPSHLGMAQAIFAAVGRVETIDNEELMDAVTALSGSGPAYGYIIIESLAEGGVKAGLPRLLATTLAAQTMLGAAAMVLQTGEHPAKLKDMVTTPAGTTVDGIMALEDGGLRVALIKAIDAATAKARELSR